MMRVISLLAICVAVRSSPVPPSSIPTRDHSFAASALGQGVMRREVKSASVGPTGAASFHDAGIRYDWPPHYELGREVILRNDSAALLEGLQKRALQSPRELPKLTPHIDVWERIGTYHCDSYFTCLGRGSKFSWDIDTGAKCYEVTEQTCDMTGGRHDPDKEWKAQEETENPTYKVIRNRQDAGLADGTSACLTASRTEKTSSDYKLRICPCVGWQSEHYHSQTWLFSEHHFIQNQQYGNFVQAAPLGAITLGRKENPECWIWLQSPEPGRSGSGSNMYPGMESGKDVRKKSEAPAPRPRNYEPAQAPPAWRDPKMLKTAHSTTGFKEPAKQRKQDKAVSNYVAREKRAEEHSSDGTFKRSVTDNRDSDQKGSIPYGNAPLGRRKKSDERQLVSERLDDSSATSRPQAVPKDFAGVAPP